MIISSTTHAQKSNYCDAVKEQFYQAVKNGYLSEIDYTYYKLLSICDVSLFETNQVAEAFGSKGYQLQMNPDLTYRVVGYTESIVNSNLDPITFDQLEKNHPIRTKYTTVQDFLKSLQLDLDDLPLEPHFIPGLHAAWIHQYGGDKVVHIDQNAILISHDGQNLPLEYGGNGLFVSNQENRTWVYKIEPVDQTNVRVRKIIDEIGEATLINFDDKHSYIVVTDLQTEDYDRNKTIYDSHGKPLERGLSQVILNPVSETLIIQKESNQKLVDKSLKTLFDNGFYIFEIVKNDVPYFIVEDHDDNRDIIDLKGKVILSSKEYSSININQTPYAIVRKNKLYGVIDYTTGKELIPYQNERIRQLRPGILYWKNENEFIISDENNQTLSRIQATNIAELHDGATLYIKAANDDKKLGIYTVFGEEILPMEYDEIAFKNQLGGRLQVKKGSEEFITDMKGKKTSL